MSASIYARFNQMDGKHWVAIFSPSVDKETYEEIEAVNHPKYGIIKVFSRFNIYNAENPLFNLLNAYKVKGDILLEFSTLKDAVGFFMILNFSPKRVGFEMELVEDGKLITFTFLFN
jgi:hypothetical protein